VKPIIQIALLALVLVFSATLLRATEEDCPKCKNRLLVIPAKVGLPETKSDFQKMEKIEIIFTGCLGSQSGKAYVCKHCWKWRFTDPPARLWRDLPPKEIEDKKS
jgi:hypothetical protein